jgi:hypothetical protein
VRAAAERLGVNHATVLRRIAQLDRKQQSQQGSESTYAPRPFLPIVTAAPRLCSGDHIGILRTVSRQRALRP